MAKQPWYDRPIDAIYGISAKDAAAAAAIVTVPAAVAGYAHGKIEQALSAPAPKVKPSAGPRNIKGQFSKGGAIRNAVTAVQRANRALAPAVAASLPVAAKVAKVGGAAGLALGAGIVVYNMATGKHAWDREAAMQRPNDPGRITSAGIAGSTTAAVANRALTGVVAQTAGGMVARAAGPIGIGVLAGIGAYKGYAEEGPKGAVRGAVRGIDPTALFMSRPLSERLTDKVLGPKQVDRIGPLLKAPFKLGDAGGAPSRRAVARSDQQSGPTYSRTYTRGPKAGTTETVRKAA